MDVELGPERDGVRPVPSSDSRSTRKGRLVMGGAVLLFLGMILVAAGAVTKAHMKPHAVSEVKTAGGSSGGRIHDDIDDAQLPDDDDYDFHDDDVIDLRDPREVRCKYFPAYCGGKM